MRAIGFVLGRSHTARWVKSSLPLQSSTEVTWTISQSPHTPTSGMCRGAVPTAFHGRAQAGLGWPRSPLKEGSSGGFTSNSTQPVSCQGVRVVHRVLTLTTLPNAGPCCFRILALAGSSPTVTFSAPCRRTQRVLPPPSPPLPLPQEALRASGLSSAIHGRLDSGIERSIGLPALRLWKRSSMKPFIPQSVARSGSWDTSLMFQRFNWGSPSLVILPSCEFRFWEPPVPSAVGP